MISHLKNEKGAVSVVELLIALALIAALIAGGYDMLTLGLGIHTTTVAKSDLQRQAQSAINSMVDDLRSAKLVTDAGAGQVAFTDTSGNALCYYVQNGNLMRATNGSYSGGTIMVNGVTALSFTYSKADGSTAINPSDVAIVAISISATNPADNKASITLKGEANLRNFGTP